MFFQGLAVIAIVIFFAAIIFLLRRPSSMLYHCSSGQFHPGLYAFLIYMFFVYALATAMNCYNNSRNSHMLQISGKYPNAIQVCPAAYERFERETSYSEMMEYFSIRGDIQKVQQQIKLRNVLDGT